MKRSITFCRSISFMVSLLLILSLFTPISAFATNQFVDVAEDNWYYTPVMWAIEQNIANGIGDQMFGPNDTCTREQVVTFLWAANGRPTPNNSESIFSDVAETDWYYIPVMWAVENGITKGISENEFGVGTSCTRAQVATMLWAANGNKAPSITENPFIDVSQSDWYYSPVMWAFENNVTKGIEETNSLPTTAVRALKL